MVARLVVPVQRRRIWHPAQIWVLWVVHRGTAHRAVPPSDFADQIMSCFVQQLLLILIPFDGNRIWIVFRATQFEATPSPCVGVDGGPQAINHKLTHFGIYGAMKLHRFEEAVHMKTSPDCGLGILET